MTLRTTLPIAVFAAAALPASASAATQTSTYTVLKASGTQTVEFTASGDTCARFGTCGFGGTVTYKFSGKPKGKLVMKQNSRGHIQGVGKFKTRGATVSNITSGGACTDTIRHKREYFELGSKSRLGRLVFGLHGDKTDYLITDCAGPTEKMLKRDNALPNGKFKRAHFDSPSTTFTLDGSSNFRESGYVGSVTWKLKYRVKRG